MQNRYDQIILRVIYRLIGLVIITTMLVVGLTYVVTKARAETCMKQVVQGPAIGSKVGGEYGQLKTLEDHQVILTFDDGPHPHNSPIIQNILKRECISAVFFFVGQQAYRYPDLVIAAVNNGHKIGSHSWSHPQPFQRLSNWTTSAEITNGVSALREITTRITPYFRYPGLGHNAYTEKFTRDLGLTVWSIDIDPKDYREPGTSALVSRILSQLHEQHRGIIVLHENHATSVAALPTIIKALRDNNYQIVGVQ